MAKFCLEDMVSAVIFATSAFDFPFIFFLFCTIIVKSIRMNFGPTQSCEFDQIFFVLLPGFFRNCLLDTIKVIIFNYLYWFTYAIVFLAGTSRVSILCLGYVCFSFMFFWQGQDLLIKARKHLLHKLVVQNLINQNEMMTQWSQRFENF